MLELIVISSIFLFFSCKDENPTTITSNIFHTQENSTNHLKLEISSSDSRLIHTENLNFTSDSILVILEIIGLRGEGTGDVHLYEGKSTTISAYYFNRDTLITDTIFYKPERATITFRYFSGHLKFQMDSL